jgi:ABC-2 type transport system permease protein
VTFAPYRVTALLAKELAELRRHRVALVPVLILAVTTVAMPFFIALVIPMIVGEPLSGDPEFARAVKHGSDRGESQMSDEAAVQVFIFQQFMLLQLLIPVTGAMAFAGYSLVGEKQGRTLEPLLATPITTAELLIAKGLGALLPSLAIMLGALAVYMAGMLAFAAPHVFPAVMNGRAALLVLGFGPIGALVALQIAVIVSSRVNDPRTAQQFGALLILPITFVFVMQFNGALRLTIPVIAVALAVLFVVWLLLVLLGVALFEREAILTRLK